MWKNFLISLYFWYFSSGEREKIRYDRCNPQIHFLSSLSSHFRPSIHFSGRWKDLSTEFIYEIRAFSNSSRDIGRSHSSKQHPSVLELKEKTMENRRSVNSPRRILSFSKNRRATLFFPDPDERASGFGVSGEPGPKPSEVYGFVGSITTVIATVVFMVWAYVPEHWLHSVGIYYYPSRYWALAVPTYAMVTVVLAIGFYIGLNFMVTPPTSFNTMFDEYSREPVSLVPSVDEDEPPIQPMSDIGINRINDVMFNNLK